MAGLIIPADVGGVDNFPVTPEPQAVAKELIIPTDVGGQAQVAPPPQVQQEDPSLWQETKDVVSGAYEDVKSMLTGDLTPEQEAMEEVGDYEAGSFFGNLKLGIANTLAGANPEARKDIMKKVIPGIKFKDTEEGTLAIYPAQGDQPAQERWLNKRGMSEQDFKEIGAETLLFMPAGIAAQLAKTTGVGIPLAAALAGGTEYAKQKILQLAGSEQEVDTGQVAMAGVLGAVPEALTRGVGAFKKGVQKGAGRVFEKEAGRAVKQIEGAPGTLGAREITEQTGVELSLPQQTLAKSAGYEQQVLAGSAGGGDIAEEFITKQDVQLEQFTDKFLDSIATPEKAATAAKQVKSAAQKTFDAKKKIRAEAASPLYKEAMLVKAPIDIALTKKAVADAGKDVLGKKPAYLKELGAKLGVDKKTKPTTAQLHKSKIWIDDQLGKFGDGALGKSEKRELMKIKDTLLNELDNQNDLYKQARQAYIDASPAVTKLEESILGEFVNIPDHKLKQIGTKIFDVAEGEADPKHVLNIKKNLDEVDPEAFSNLLRMQLQKNLRKVPAKGEVSPTKRLQTVFGTKSQEELYKTGMTVAQKKNFNLLKHALKRAEFGRDFGSRTDPMGEARRRIVGGVAQGAIESSGNITGSLGAFIINTLRSKTSQVAQLEAEERIAKIIFNPDHAKALKAIRKLDPNSKKAVTLFKRLYESAAKAQTQQLNKDQ